VTQVATAGTADSCSWTGGLRVDDQ